MAGLRRYEPWGMLSQLQNEIDRLFENRMEPAARGDVPTSDWVPAVDVKEEDDKYVITADVPGVDPKDITVHLENGVLSVSGTRQHKNTQSGGDYKRVERIQGNFFRRFSLPDSVDDERVSAKSAHGVLEITIPKAERAKSRKISVEA